MDFIEEALAAYGATLQDGVIVTKKGVKTTVRAVVKNNRLRFESMQTKQLLFSGPMNEQAVHAFVKSFWFWKS